MCIFWLLANREGKMTGCVGDVKNWAGQLGVSYPHLGTWNADFSHDGQAMKWQTFHQELCFAKAMLFD
jgi:hypothetical protein